MSVVTCGGCHQGARAAVNLTRSPKRLPRWVANGSAAWLKLKNPSASAGGLARRPAFEDQGRMSPCLADLDGSRWRSAVFLNYQSGRRVSVALRKQLPGNKGRSDRPEANSGEVFSGGFGVAGPHSPPLRGRWPAGQRGARRNSPSPPSRPTSPSPPCPNCRCASHRIRSESRRCQCGA